MCWTEARLGFMGRSAVEDNLQQFGKHEETSNSN